MKRPTFRLANTNPYLIWPQLALKTSEMLFASAQVIGHRTNRMLMAGINPSDRDRREFTLMGQEKLEAAAESAQAIAARMVLMQTQFGALAFRQILQGMSGMFALAASPATVFTAKAHADALRRAMSNSASLATHLSGSVGRLAHHGLRPIHSRATGNARRLLKPKAGTS